MDKLYAIKIRQSDGTYGAAIPVSVLAENVDWNSTLSLVDILGQVDTSESIQDQINNLKNTKATQASVNALDQKVDNAVEYITHNSEIADAREGADGTEYNTLKERLDSEYNDLQSKNASSLVMVNENPEDTTKVNITTSESTIDLALQSDLDAVNNRITSLTTRKLIVISDSYADANRGGYAHGFYTVMLAVLGMTDGVDAFLYQKGGAGFVGNGQGKTFGDLLEDAITNMTVEERATITDIFVCGGANDEDFAATSVSAAKDTFYNRVISQFPNAWLYYAMTSGFIEYAQRIKLYTVSEYVYNYNLQNRLTLITNAHLPMCLCDSFSGGTDRVHPNATGCKRIGWLLAGAFRSKSSLGTFFMQGAFQNVTGTPASGITAVDGNPIFRVYSTGTALQIASITKWHFSGTFNITYNNGISVLLFTYPLTSPGLVSNNSANSAISGLGTIPVTAEAFVSTSEAYMLPGELHFIYNSNSNNMSVCFTTRTAPKTVTATTLRVKPFNHTTVY